LWSYVLHSFSRSCLRGCSKQGMCIRIGYCNSGTLEQARTCGWARYRMEEEKV
jgi:hypothetical protein